MNGTSTASATPIKVTAPAITTPLQTDPTNEISQRALSPSQVNTWLGCNAAWMFRNLWKLPDPPNVALAIGSAIDETVSAVLRAPKPKNDEQRVVHAGMAARQILADIGRELARVPEEAMMHESRSDIEGLALAMVNAVLPTLEGIHPVAVQESITGEIGGVPVNSILDVRVPGEIIDIKTAANKPTSFGGADVRQLATYAELGKQPTVRRITITKRKVAVYEQVMPPIEVHFEKQHLAQLYPLVREQMATGLYAPNRDHKYCSRKQCSFWRACQKEFGGCVPEG